MHPAVLRFRWLLLTVLIFAVAACGNKNPPPVQAQTPSNPTPVTEASQPPVAQTPERQEEPEEEKEPDKTVTVKGYGAIIEGDIQKARDEALMDAYVKAISTGLGVMIYGKTVVKQFQLVEQEVMAERKGYVKSFEILKEDPEGEFGYMVEVKAVVSNDPISEIDDLKFKIRLMGNPRLMVYVESSQGNSAVIEGAVLGPLSKAGYQLVDREQMERIIEQDFERQKLLGDWEAAAILGKRFGADVSIMGDVSAEVTSRTQSQPFPLISAMANVNFKVVATETGEILHVIANEDFQDSRDRIDHANTDAAAIDKAIAKAVGKVAEKLMWELPSKIGTITARLRVYDCTYSQAEQLTKFVKSLRLVEDARLVDFQSPIAEIQVETTGRIANLASNLAGVQDMALEVQGFKLGSIEVKVLKPEGN